MIVTLTANPSLDRTITLAEPLQPGEVQAATSAREDAGGKGINVARVVAAAGARSLAVLPLALDDPFDIALRATTVAARSASPSPATPARTSRSPTRAVSPRSSTSPAPSSAPPTSRRSSTPSSRRARARGGSRWPGRCRPVPATGFYVDVIRAVRAKWGTDAPLIAVDTSGAALDAVVAEGRPDLIKPNDEELAQLASVALEGGRRPRRRGAARRPHDSCPNASERRS